MPVPERAVGDWLRQVSVPMGVPKDLATNFNKGWDCTITMSGKLADGSDLSHAEHIKFVTRSSETGRAVITTADGFTQGGPGHDLSSVDAATETNFYNIGKPGEGGSFRGSTDPDHRRDMRGATIDKVSYVCCQI